MRHRLEEGKSRKAADKNGSNEFQQAFLCAVSIDDAADVEIDPAEFWDAEEFGYRRELKLFRR